MTLIIGMMHAPFRAIANTTKDKFPVGNANNKTAVDKVEPKQMKTISFL